MSASGVIRAGRAFVELFADDAKLIRGLRRAQARLKAWGAAVTRIGGAIFAGASAAIAPLIGAAKHFAATGDAIDKMSARTGASAETLSELGFAAEQSGSDLVTVEKGVRKMQQRLADAAGGSKSAAAALAELGLSAAALSELAPDEQLEAIADRIAEVDNPARRTAAAMELFGEESGAKLIPLLSTGAKGIKELRDEAHRLGLTISGEDATAAAAFTDAMNRLWRSLKGGVFRIGAALAPLLTTLADLFNDVAVTASNWIRENQRLVVQVFTIAAAVAGVGATLLGLGLGLKLAGGAVGAFATVLSISGRGLALFGRAAGLVVRVLSTGVGTIAKLALTLLKSALTALVSGVTAGFGALSAGIGAVLTPVGLLGAALVGIGVAIVYFSGAIGRAISGGKKLFGELKTDALTAWGAITDALAAGDLAAAAAVAWAGLKLAWARGTAYVEEQWVEFKDFFLNVWSNATTSLAQIFSGAWAGIQLAGVEAAALVEYAWISASSAIQKSILAVEALMADLAIGALEKSGQITAEQSGLLRIASNLAIGAKRKQIDSETGGAATAAVAKAAAREAEILRQGKERSGLLEGDRQREEKARRAKADARLQAGRDAVAAAQNEFNTAVAAARKAKDDPQTKKRPKFENRIAEFRSANFSSSGTFSARAVAGLGVSTHQQKMLAALVNIEKNTNKLPDLTAPEFE